MQVIFIPQLILTAMFYDFFTLALLDLYISNRVQSYLQDEWPQMTGPLVQ